MSKFEAVMAKGKKYFHALNTFTGERLLGLPLLPNEFKIFNSIKLDLDTTESLNSLVGDIGEYLEQEVKPEYNFIGNDVLVNLSNNIKYGIENNLLINDLDRDIFDQIFHVRKIIEELKSCAKLRRQILKNIPGALKLYGSKIGGVLEDKKSEIADLLVTAERRSEIFYDTVAKLLLDCLEVSNSDLNKLFLIQCITIEDYMESYRELTLSSVADQDYKVKLQNMWFGGGNFIEKSEPMRIRKTGNSVVEWASMVPFINDVAYRVLVRSEALKSLDSVQSTRKSNSGPLLVEGYLVLSAIMFYGVGVLVARYFMRNHINNKRATYTCHNCAEMFTIAVGKSDFLGSQNYTVQVATQNHVTNNDGKKIATIHGQKEEVRVAHIYNEHRCCLSCGVIFEQQTSK